MDRADRKDLIRRAERALASWRIRTHRREDAWPHLIADLPRPRRRTLL